MLFTAEGNDHRLGLMLAEYFFVSCGIATDAVLQGIFRPDGAWTCSIPGSPRR